ncbi:beta-lactamase family protein [bacterium]|nr:beta-lactamase family protein [bacterium]
MLRIALLCTLLLTALTGCTPDGNAAHEARFAAVLDSLVVEYGLIGATAAYVLPDGTPGRAVAGVADATTGAAMPPDARMITGSIGKTWVAAVALMLAHEGKLDLDAPLSDCLGDRPWFDRLPNGGLITLRHCLRHEAGVPDHIETDRFVEEVSAKVVGGEDPDFAFEHEYLLSFIFDREPVHEPGAGWHYTDTHYFLVGLAIESVTGRRYDDLVRERLLEPLGLEDTDPTDRRALPRLVAGHPDPENPFGLGVTVTEAPGLMAHNPALEWTGGGIVSTSSDLARWAKLLYEGRAFDADYVDELLDGVAMDEADPGAGAYGLGAFVESSSLGPKYGHTGWYPGYHSLVAYYAEGGFAIALQINRDYDTHLRAIAAVLAETVSARLRP